MKHLKHGSQSSSSFPTSSTAYVIQKKLWAHLHGGVSKGIPKAFPGPPHHTIVILALVLPIAVELPIQVGSMTSANIKMSKLEYKQKYFLTKTDRNSENVKENSLRDLMFVTIQQKEIKRWQ